MKFFSKTMLALSVMASLSGGSTVKAALIAYDGFAYQPGTLLAGQSGGFGFANAWAPGGFNTSISNNYTIGTGSLSSGTLATSGNSVSATATNALSGLTRSLSTGLGDSGTTSYISILMRPNGPVTGGTFENFYGMYLTSSVGSDAFIGKSGNGPTTFYDLEDRGGTDQYNTGVMAQTGQTVLLVLRIDFIAGIDRLTLYANPTPGATEPFLGAVKQDRDLGTVTGLTLYSTGAFSVDEIRVGTTFADVVPTVAVPEPTSLALLCLGGFTSWGGVTIRRRVRARWSQG